MGERKRKRKAATEGAEHLEFVALRLPRATLEKAKADAAAGNRPLSRHLRGLLVKAIEG